MSAPFSAAASGASHQPRNNGGRQALAPELWAELHTAALVVVKGDLNYRKLLADRHWPPTAPFAAAAHPFVAVPFVALRTLKVACLPHGAK